MAFMSYGLFAFELATLLPDELRRRRSWTFAANARLGARDSLQPVGPGEDRFTLSGKAIAELQDGDASLDELVAMANQQQSWPLCDAEGYVYGDYVITSLDEGATAFGRDGRAIVRAFSLELQAVQLDTK
jgi:uncharacterized protein